MCAHMDHAVGLEDHVELPPDAEEWPYLHATRTRSLCPWKGIASILTVTVVTPDGEHHTDRDAAWTYRRPWPFARRIKEHVAFSGRVRIDEVHPGDPRIPARAQRSLPGALRAGDRRGDPHGTPLVRARSPRRAR